MLHYFFNSVIILQHSVAASKMSASLLQSPGHFSVYTAEFLCIFHPYLHIYVFLGPVMDQSAIQGVFLLGYVSSIGFCDVE